MHVWNDSSSSSTCKSATVGCRLTCRPTLQRLQQEISRGRRSKKPTLLPHYDARPYTSAVTAIQIIAL
jgi:hypothetical protein